MEMWNIFTGLYFWIKAHAFFEFKLCAKWWALSQFWPMAKLTPWPSDLYSKTETTTKQAELNFTTTLTYIISEYKLTYLPLVLEYK